jgi:hypothetical protein
MSNNVENWLDSIFQPDYTCFGCESSVSVCIEGTVAIPEAEQSLIPECFDTSGYVRSLFVLDSPINALADSYPVTWLTKVVALMLKIDWIPSSNQITRVLVVQVYLTEVQTETVFT